MGRGAGIAGCRAGDGEMEVPPTALPPVPEQSTIPPRTQPRSILGGSTYQWENFKVVFIKSTLQFLVAFYVLITKNIGVELFGPGK